MMIEIDGSEGEGGGQILRSSLALSIHTQQPFRITKIRANRDRPGLMQQHLTSVRAAGEICGADMIGANKGSRELTFRPGKLTPGNYSFAIGTAGSCTLVLQTVLPALLLADAPSTVRITGGTHNRGSPPFDFLQRAFLPQIAHMGAKVEIELARYGFYPRGGGEIRATILPSQSLTPIHIHERGTQLRAYAEAYVAALPLNIAQRELEVIGQKLKWTHEQLSVHGLPNDMGPGNAVTITVEHEQVTEVFTGFGERGVRAETVAGAAVEEAQPYLSHTAPVGEHLADQLLLPMALAKGGSFTTTTISQHLLSNALVIETFLGAKTTIEAVEYGHRVTVTGR
jgi:RNA 3'-terminal phosphate cyclase (ATP)